MYYTLTPLLLEQTSFILTCELKVIQPRLWKRRSGAGSEIDARLKPSCLMPIFYKIIQSIVPMS